MANKIEINAESVRKDAIITPIRTGILLQLIFFKKKVNYNIYDLKEK